MNININIYRRKNEILDNNILLVLCLSFACPGYARIAYWVSYEIIEQ